MATDGNLQRRTGGDSLIFIGRQTQRGAHITGDTVFQGTAPDWSDLNAIVAALINQRFPFVRNTLDPTSESTESESITGNNAAVPGHHHQTLRRWRMGV